MITKFKKWGLKNVINQYHTKSDISVYLPKISMIKKFLQQFNKQ